MASKTLTEMQKDLICKICDHPARPWKKQWYRCLNLHQICQDCKGKNKKCSCGEPISKEYCKMTEKLLSDKSVKRMKLNCVNMKNGCQETFDENALENHESECIYSAVLAGKCNSVNDGSMEPLCNVSNYWYQKYQSELEKRSFTEGI